MKEFIQLISNIGFIKIGKYRGEITYDRYTFKNVNSMYEIRVQCHSTDDDANFWWLLNGIRPSWTFITKETLQEELNMIKKYFLPLTRDNTF